MDTNSTDAGANRAKDDDTNRNLQSISPFFIVKDLQVSIAYYIERFGFRLDFQGPDDGVYYAGVSRDGLGIMLKTIVPDVLPQPNHTRHEWARWDAYIYTRDPDALFDEFSQRGASFVKKLSFIDDGLWGFEVTDADGYVLAFFHLRNKQTVYEAAGGREGLLRLASAWHTRVLEDEVVSHAFSHGYHPQHTERLAAYWAEVLGGPRTYSDRYGDETSVVRMHSGNGAHEEMDQRAIACFDRALEDTGLARDERLRRVLHDYFAWSTTTTMARYHHSAEDVPEGLRIPKWSWDGLVSEGDTVDRGET